MNVSPKSRFLQQEGLARQFLDQVDSEAFTRATELAMLQLMEESESIEQIKGAKRFLEILKALPEQAVSLPKRSAHTLNHDLK
jgi:hypothetical protein